MTDTTAGSERRTSLNAGGSASADPDVSVTPTRPQKGRSIRPSGARQTMIEVLRFTEKVPTVSQLRRSRIPRLASVRADASVRISWAMLFFAAYARVCSRMPVLRRVYVRWPITRFYEHPHTVGRMTMVREIDGEEVVFLTRVADAERMTLKELDDNLRAMVNQDADEHVLLKRQQMLNRAPWFLKTFGWKTLLWSGRWRTLWLGTFGLTTVSKFGSLPMRPPTFSTSTLSYGPVTPEGDVDVVLTYDHRVLDGADCARTLAELERELETSIADELESLQLADGGEHSPA